MLHDAIPLYHSDTSSLYLLPILQSSETAPGSRMALQPHPRSTVQQSRVRGSPLAGHRASGSDDDPSIEEGRGTPHDTPEGLEPSSCRSDHSNPVHTTLELPSRRRLGQGVKLHPSCWTSHHHAVQGLFTMIGRHRVGRRLINVYWGTTLNCILPTPSPSIGARR